MNFIDSSMEDLLSLPIDHSYAGGSNLANINEFQSYILNKDPIGVCDATMHSTCYFYFTANVKRDENLLLEKGFSCNQQSSANTESACGYVYVVDNLT